MMKDSGCPFCRIVRGEMKSDVVLQTPTAIAVRDINPQAPDHVLVIPNEHVDSLAFVHSCHSVANNHAPASMELSGGVVRPGSGLKDPPTQPYYPKGHP